MTEKIIVIIPIIKLWCQIPCKLIKNNKFADFFMY